MDFLKHSKGEYAHYLKTLSDKLNQPTKELQLLDHSLANIMVSILSFKNLDSNCFG